MNHYQYFSDKIDVDKLHAAEAECPLPDFVDGEYSIYFIEKVEYENEWGPYDVTMSDGWSFYVRDEFGLGYNEERIPKVGDFVRMWGAGIGSPVRGVQVNDYLYSYRTPQQQKLQHETWSKAYQWQKYINFKKKSEQYYERINALPQFLQDRIHKFQADNEDYDWEYGSYELASCEEAYNIYKHFKGRYDDLIAFTNADYETQSREYTCIIDGISGNMYGFAIALAAEMLRYDQGEQEASYLPGALTPITGTYKKKE